jgi:hypothetical protein
VRSLQCRIKKEAGQQQHKPAEVIRSEVVEQKNYRQKQKITKGIKRHRLIYYGKFIFNSVVAPDYYTSHYGICIDRFEDEYQ